MKVVVASVEWDGDPGPDDRAAAAMAEWLGDRGHQAERIVVPASSDVTPQQTALACQLLATDAYADALWTLNFPACALPHARKRVWITTARPFATGRGPQLRDAAALLGADACVTVASDALGQVLALPSAGVGLPPAVVTVEQHAARATPGSGLVRVTLDPPPEKEGSSHAICLATSARDRSVERRILGASAILVGERELALAFDLVLMAVEAGVAVFEHVADGTSRPWNVDTDARHGDASTQATVRAVAHAQRAWLHRERESANAVWADDLERSQ